MTWFGDSGKEGEEGFMMKSHLICILEDEEESSRQTSAWEQHF